MTAEAFTALGLDRDSSPELIRYRWRQVAAEHHPDRGGDPAEFTRLHACYQEALTQALADPCPACRGAGVVAVNRGFSSVELRCDVCRGTKKRWAG